MARTKDEIVTAMLADKADRSELDGLSSSSSSAIWRLLIDVVATAAKVVEDLWDIFMGEVDALENSAIAGTARWYQEQALAYQQGDTLIWSGQRWGYLSVDASKQIVDKASATDTGSELRLKVAKVVSGTPQALSESELAGFNSYIKKIKFAGTNVAVVSLPPDELKLTMTVYKDPAIIDSDGDLLPGGSFKIVEFQVSQYVSNLDWNGKFNVQEMIDAIKLADGVRDVVVSTIEAKPDAYASFSAFTREYTPQAGYLSINTLTITYLNV